MTLASPTPPSTAGAAARPGEAIVYARETGLGVVTFEGPDAATFLHGQLSSDVTGMPVGDAAWTSYNSPKGRMLATLLLWRAGPASFRAYPAADLTAAFAKRIAMFVLRAKVKVADLSGERSLFGVAGPGAAEAVRAVLGAAAPAAGQGSVAGAASVVATPDGRLVVDAATAQADALAQQLSAHAQAVASEHWDWLGIRAGVPVITRATQEHFVPQNANWDLVGGVNFHKGCYPGQEIVARMQYLGRLKERLFAFHADGSPPAPGTPLYSAAFEGQACGTVVNAAPAPEGGSDLLAVLQWSASSLPVHLAAADGPLLAPRALPYAVPEPVAAERPKLQ